MLDAVLRKEHVSYFTAIALKSSHNSYCEFRKCTLAGTFNPLYRWGPMYRGNKCQNQSAEPPDIGVPSMAREKHGECKFPAAPTRAVGLEAARIPLDLGAPPANRSIDSRNQISLIAFPRRRGRSRGPIPSSAAAKNMITFPIMHGNALHALRLTSNVYARKLRPRPATRFSVSISRKNITGQM